MKIIVVGCGKTGYAIARRLLSGGHDVVIIDKKPLELVTESLDVLLLQGSGTSRAVLEQAGVQSADLIISVLPNDEANVVCCMTAKLLGAQYAAARVSDPEYALELNSMHHEFGIDMILNPDQLSALAISRLMRYPSADEVETFARGYIELVSFRVSEGDGLDNLNVAQVAAKFKSGVVFAMINHEGSAVIPKGDAILHVGSTVSILGKPGQITDFFKQTKKRTEKVRDIMIVGGGAITYYLARFIAPHGISAKILEISEERCNELSQALPGCLIINGDGTDQELLHEENIRHMDAVICLTNRDEENIVIGLYGSRLEIPKIVVKINHLGLGMASNLNLGSIISPQTLIAEQTENYVSGLCNALAKNVRTAYTVFENERQTIRVLEFIAPPGAACIGAPLEKLRFKRGLIIGSIIRRSAIVTPVGSTVIQAGDTVIVVTAEDGISDINDILEVI